MIIIIYLSFLHVLRRFFINVSRICRLFFHTNQLRIQNPNRVMKIYKISKKKRSKVNRLSRLPFLILHERITLYNIGNISRMGIQRTRNRILFLYVSDKMSFSKSFFLLNPKAKSLYYSYITYCE